MAPSLLTIDNSNISNTTLHNVNLIKCTIRHVELHDCIITNCTLYHCKVHRCTIISSELADSKVFDGTISKCRLNLTSAPQKMMDLAKVPVAVRWAIYKHCLVWDGKTPPLLAALRPHKDLYQEALGVFRNRNVFCISERNEESRKEMTVEAAQGIKHLQIVTEKNQKSRSIIEELNDLFELKGSFTSVDLLIHQRYEQNLKQGSKAWAEALHMHSEHLKKISIRFNGKCSFRQFEMCDDCESAIEDEYYYAHRMLFKKNAVKWEYSMVLHGIEAHIKEDGFRWDGPEYYEKDLMFEAPLYGPRSSSKKYQVPQSVRKPESKISPKISQEL